MTLTRIPMEDVKFCVAAADDIMSFSDMREVAKPTFLIYKNGRRIETIEGIDGPRIERIIQAAK